jgi:hypothetical protein
VGRGGPAVECATQRDWGGAQPVVTVAAGGRHWPESTGRGRPFKTGEREVADRWGHAAQSRATRFDLIRIQIQTNSNVIETISNFDPSKKDLIELKKF